MTIHIRRVGHGWDTYPAVHFEWTPAATEWADTVGPLFLNTLRETCPVNKRAHFDNVGRLRASLRMERDTSEHHLTMEFTANTPYAGYVVTGVEPHVMRPVNFRYMHWWDRPIPGHEYFSKFVVHGSRHPQGPDPFHERAMDRDREEISHRFVDIMTEHLRRALEE